MAREAIALALDVEPPEVGHISMEVIPPANVVDLLSTIDQAIATADEANAVVASTRREAAERLRLAGLPVRDVGHLLGLSHQRVSQILAR